MNLWSGGGEKLRGEGGDWENSLESGEVDRFGGMVVVGGRGTVTGAELCSSDIVMVSLVIDWLVSLFLGSSIYFILQTR